MTLYAHTFATPVGDALAAVDEGGAVVYLGFLNGRAPQELAEQLGEPPTWDGGRCRQVQQQVAEYFAGRRRTFDLEVAPRGTRFQQAVWRELLRIPFGRTASYREVAERLGNPGAVRAVGRANGANPVSLLVPCHRVIGADGSLTGYGGGIEVKRALLVHEGALLA